METKYDSIKVPDAPDNSYSKKQEGVKIKAAGQTKNSQFRSTFRNAVRNIGTDIILPTVKDLTYNAFSNFVGNMIYGVDNTPRQPQRRSIGQSMNRYNDYGAMSRRSYSNNGAGLATDRYSQPRNVYDYQDIAWTDDPADIPNGMTGHQKAELARGALIDKLEENCMNNPNRPYVTVLDLKEIAMWNPITSVDDMWGWYDLSITNTKVRRGLDNRWYISLPPVVSVR